MILICPECGNDALDLLILQTLQWGPQHGYGISQSIRGRTPLQRLKNQQVQRALQNFNPVLIALLG